MRLKNIFLASTLSRLHCSGRVCSGREAGNHWRGHSLFNSNVPSLLKTLLLGLLLATLSLPLFSVNSNAHADNSHSLRIPNNIPVLGTPGEIIEVPIYIKRDGSTDRLRMGLDYDDFLIKFRGFDFTHENSIATNYIIKTLEPGKIQVTMNFDPDFDPENSIGGEEELLIVAKFIIPDSSRLFSENNEYSESANLTIRFDSDHTWFIPIDVDDEDTIDNPVIPDPMYSGSLDVILIDSIEVGSARATYDSQIFDLPIYVTHLEEENTTLTMGLDYDDFLNILAVTPINNSWIDSIDPVKTEPMPGNKLHSKIIVHFTPKNNFATYPQALKEHLLDITFEFSPLDSKMHEKIMIIPREYINGLLYEESNNEEDEEVGAEEEEEEEVKGQINLIPGSLHFYSTRPFVRGDVNGDTKINMADSIKLLDFSFKGQELPCVEAADINNSNKVDIADALYLLNFLFLNGGSPPTPFPLKGFDPPTPDTNGAKTSLGCSVYGDSGPGPYFELLPDEN